jgi:Zn-dependent M28 family amino/carboxypeptidase
MLASILAATVLRVFLGSSPAVLVDEMRRLSVVRDNDQRFAALTRMLDERNLPFSVESFTIDKPVGREPRTRGRNIVVSLGEGRNILVIGAHYDAARLPDGSLSQGAIDNGASSVMLVSLAEALRAERLSMQLRIVWFDMEETGHFGSRRYVESHGSDRIWGMLNFDINAYGDTLLFGAPREIGPRQQQNPEGKDAPLRRALLHTCADELLDCVRFPEMPPSDDRSFGRAGIPTLSIAMIPAIEVLQLWLMQHGDRESGLARGSAPTAWRTIHTKEDVPEKVDGATIARMQRFALAFIRRLSSSHE